MLREFTRLCSWLGLLGLISLIFRLWAVLIISKLLCSFLIGSELLGSVDELSLKSLKARSQMVEQGSSKNWILFRLLLS